MIPKTRLRVATDPKRGWQANKKCIYATAQTIRAMPEKEKPPAMRVDAYCNSILASSFVHAVAAINGAAVGGTERNLCFYAALVADDSEHFSVIISCLFSFAAAFGAASGFVFKALGCVEFLFCSGKSEFNATIFAS